MLALREKREAFGRDGGIAQLGCRCDYERILWHEARGVTLERFADCGRGRLRTRHTRAADALEVVERDAKHALVASDLARDPKDRWVGGPVQALLERSDDPRVARDGAAERRRERRGDHAASAACHGSLGAKRATAEHTGQRGTRRT